MCEDNFTVGYESFGMLARAAKSIHCAEYTTRQDRDRRAYPILSLSETAMAEFIGSQPSASGVISSRETEFYTSAMPCKMIHSP